eukprot:1018191-Rhodomonas_salina.1
MERTRHLQPAEEWVSTQNQKCTLQVDATSGRHNALSVLAAARACEHRSATSLQLVTACYKSTTSKRAGAASLFWHTSSSSSKAKRCTTLMAITKIPVMSVPILKSPEMSTDPL